jgi:serine/threonine protein kinase
MKMANNMQSSSSSGQGIGPKESQQQHLSREFAACCKLSHPSVVPVYGFSAATAKSETVLVIKQTENVSLMDVLERVKASSPPWLWMHTGRIFRIMTGIVCGLELIHWNRLVRRDLKPENYLLDKNHFSVLFDGTPGGVIPLRKAGN